MNHYTYSEIYDGLTESFKVTITKEMMEKFLEITGDINPLHCDDDYAKDKGYTGVVVYGMLTSSFYSTLVGVYIPGEHSLLLSIDTKMNKPVFVGDELTITGKVFSKHDLYNTLDVKAEIRNQNGDKISKATIVVGVKE